MQNNRPHPPMSSFHEQEADSVSGKKEADVDVGSKESLQLPACVKPPRQSQDFAAAAQFG